MKIKVNEEKQTASLKGLTVDQLSVIHTLLSHVQLGNGTRASTAAFELLNAFEECEELYDLEDFAPDDNFAIDVAHDDDSISVWISSPMLVISSPDGYEDETQRTNSW